MQRPTSLPWREVLLSVACCAAASAASAANWRLSANASITETYTNNVNYAPENETSKSDFVTSLGAGLNIHGEGARVKLDGTLAATWNLYSSETQNDSIAPNVNLLGRVEAIEKFFFVEATANASTTFISPFGPQPASLVSATNNRYINETYSVSPYMQGVLGSTNISYHVRDDNIWTASSSYGASSNRVPNTYNNNLAASLSSGTRPAASGAGSIGSGAGSIGSGAGPVGSGVGSIGSGAGPVGWTLEYLRNYYDNGLPGGNWTTQIARLIVPYQIDPQFQLSGRIGYEKDDFPLSSDQGIVYGGGFQWTPTDRTNIGGYWEHRFFGSSYSWQVRHRLPNVAISANFSRGLNNYPQLALLIPAGVTVTQFLDDAFATRIPDPAERALAIEQFLARTGLPPTLAAPVNFYGTSLLLQNRATASLVLIGVRDAVTFTVFNVDSTAISGTGEALPPALQFGQDNTQTGAGIGYSHQLTPLTNFTANASYSRTVSNNTDLSNVRSNNGNFAATLNTRFTPKTSGSAGVTYSIFRPTGTNAGRNTDAYTAFVTVTHTF